MKFEIRRSVDRQFYYVLIAKNGKVMVTSETMKRKQNCIDSIRAIKNIVGPNTPVIDSTI